jgi:UDP-N-acetylglucosamine 2-epimerase (non-hydrolysing)
MDKKKVLVVFGTRPEAIKMIPVIESLKRRDVSVKVCVTAQHRMMLDQVLQFFRLVPDFDLDLMKANQTLSELTGNILIELTQVLTFFKPNLVLVHGDTTTSMVATLASFYQRIPIGHVEAGLRTYNKYAPFPEEVNRQLIGKIADLHFAPTISAKENLMNEGVPASNILVTGNTVVDAMLKGLQLLESYTDHEIEAIKQKLDFTKEIILVTGHRRENFGDGFQSICNGLIRIAETFPKTQIVYPVHLNPNVHTTVHEILGKTSNVYLLPPLGYPAFLWLMKKSKIIITDSGGIQEEAPTIRKPVLIMRDVTERMEAIHLGLAKLVGTSSDLIFEETKKLLTDKVYFESFLSNTNPYGDGKASERIADFVMTHSMMS